MIDLRTGQESWGRRCRAPHSRCNGRAHIRREIYPSRKRQKAGGSGPPA